MMSLAISPVADVLIALKYTARRPCPISKPFRTM